MAMAMLMPTPMLMLVPGLLTLTMLAMLMPMLDARWRRARVMLLLVLR